MPSERVTVIGAGVGGLVAAVDLARQGLDVTVVERASEPGGKMRRVEIAGARLDAGPTVFTMRRVFDAIFADAGSSLAEHVELRPAGILARHAWSERERLDLHADIGQSADAIGALAGPAEARAYQAFCARCRRVWDTLEQPFIRSQRTNPMALARDVGGRGLADLWRAAPFATLWSVLGEHFRDPRLRQLFGRYATYCGSSPFLAPATLMVIAHVERDGVWLVDGGMHRIAEALARLGTARGATIRYGEQAAEILVTGGSATGVRLASGETLRSDAVVVNADVAAVAGGLLGRDVVGAVPQVSRSARSLSAVTWAMVAETDGFPLLRHNVFFSGDYAAEFDDLFGRARLPAMPTAYVCAQDRDAGADAGPNAPERLLCLVNAPATGDLRRLEARELEQCEERTFGLMRRCGLRIDRRPERTVVTTPADFERLFPGTGGALYGQASHGWMASFRRPGARSRIPRLYLAGGSTHPGAGVPMAALSGRLAAASLLADLASTSRSRRAAMPGGTSTR